MKSTIRIEMDFDSGKPIITIKFIESDDVRDKLVQRFLECFDYASNFSYVTLGHPQTESNGEKCKMAFIAPIGDKELPLFSEQVIERINIIKDKSS